jgi:hypothetical protein
VLLGYNGSAKPWPVCAIQIGLGFPSFETVRLRRIALDTGGTYVQAASDRDVPEAILQCRATATGETTLAENLLALRRRARNVKVKVPARRAMTVLLAAGSTSKAGLSLIDPAGKTRTLAKPGSGVTFVQRDSYTLARVVRPAKGDWTVRLSSARGVGARLRVTLARPGAAS